MTQQRVLETLKERAMRGEHPLVRVGDVDHSFVAVIWSGSSPLVFLRQPDGKQVAKTAAEWTRAGAKFVARLRDLAKSITKKTKKSTAQLDVEVAALVAQPSKHDDRYLPNSLIPTPKESARLDDLERYCAAILSRIHGDDLDAALDGLVRRRAMTDAQMRKVALGEHGDDLVETLARRGWSLSRVGLTEVK